MPYEPDFAEPETIGQRVRCIFPNKRFATWGKWPPNVFAVAASILSTSGGYASIVDDWRDRRKWQKTADEVGGKWRRTFEQRKRPPAAVLKAWRLVQASFGQPLLASREGALRDALVELIVFADEASAGVGIPHTDRNEIRFNAMNFLLETGTITPEIPRTLLRVLPKQHTPTAGVTLRSLTHHLSLLESSEVVVRWNWIPGPEGLKDRNLLIIPWPYSIKSKDFKIRKLEAGRAREFDYAPSADDPTVLAEEISRLLAKAKKKGIPIHGIVLPESSMSLESLRAASEIARRAEAFLVGGVRDRTVRSNKPLNRAAMHFYSDETRQMVGLRQSKHHRWKLGTQQIKQYGLSRALGTNDVWESTTISRRTVNFICLSTDFVICCMICEDLARQDPIADVVRIVGPNLVIALLLDGPQIKVRWPGQYASVLSDDPGSSVLTLSSKGMVERSKPLKKAKASKSIALWKDAINGAREISLTRRNSAAIIKLGTKAANEVTIDGRRDGGTTYYPVVNEVIRI